MADSYVGKPCPKCRHVRQANEVAPDWQCPKCGVAYAKFVQAQTMPPTNPGVRVGAGSAPAAPARGSGGSSGLPVFAHLSIPIGMVIPFLSLIAPIVIWVTQGGKNDAAVAAAKESINFQISLTLWALLLLGMVLAGAVLPPLFYAAVLVGVVLGLGILILPIVAAVKVSGGDSYAYPLTWHLFT
jgi:uncharacterized Tic20 family protein